VAIAYKKENLGSENIKHKVELVVLRVFWWKIEDKGTLKMVHSVSSATSKSTPSRVL
jgi:hypothetical protein